VSPSILEILTASNEVIQIIFLLICNGKYEAALGTKKYRKNVVPMKALSIYHNCNYNYPMMKCVKQSSNNDKNMKGPENCQERLVPSFLKNVQHGISIISSFDDITHCKIERLSICALE
jgi:hypothetical protein